MKLEIELCNNKSQFHFFQSALLYILNSLLISGVILVIFFAYHNINSDIKLVKISKLEVQFFNDEYTGVRWGFSNLDDQDKTIIKALEESGIKGIKKHQISPLYYDLDNNRNLMISRMSKKIKVDGSIIAIVSLEYIAQSQLGVVTNVHKL